MEVTNGVLGSILEVFTQLSQWIPNALNNMVPVFYGTDGLTFMGTLGVAALSFSVVFLLLGIVQKFLKFGA